MKKNLFMVAAVALMAMVSCNKEEIGNSGVQAGAASDIVFSAELEQPGAPAAEQTPAEAQTKTSLGTTTGDVTSVNWVAGDKVKINGVEFSATESGTRTDFTTLSSFNAAATYYAVYPASAAGASDLSKVTIPASQTGTFAEAAISVAKSDTESLKFKNVASIVKFQVPSACSEITIESTANLAGTFNVTFNGETPSVGSVSNGSKKITLSGSFAAGTDYYVAVLPGSHKFTIRIGGYLSKASTKTVTTKRATFSNLQTLPALEASDYALVGAHTGWGFSNLTVLYKDVDGFAAYNLSGLSEFKVVNKTATGWDSSVKTNKGVGTTIDASGITEMSLSDNSNNIKVVSSSVSYDIIVKTDLSKITVQESELSGDATIYSITGSNGNWDSDIVFLTTKTNNVIVAKNVTIKTDVGVKIRQDKEWTDSWSCDWKALKVNTKMDCRKGYDCNMLFADGSSDWNKNYDIYVQLSSNAPSKFIIVTAGSNAPTF
ncbi:MAG: hypothetical protein E7111_01795 [Bacteroidales bacterium]|nr:hypothetical protein [Bacteroidales bacterium]